MPPCHFSLEDPRGLVLFGGELESIGGTDRLHLADVFFIRSLIELYLKHGYDGLTLWVDHGDFRRGCYTELLQKPPHSDEE